MDYFEDYKDMLQLFNKYNVKYLVIELMQWETMDTAGIR